MYGKQQFGILSTAASTGHPLHSLLVTLPIGFLIGAFLSDITFYGSGDSFWARGSAWLIGAGLMTGLLAAIAGLVDFLASERIRSTTIALLHFGGNVIALVLTAVNLYLRTESDMTFVTGEQMLLSNLVVLILAVTGWFGGVMVLRHGAGVIGDEPADSNQRTGSREERAYATANKQKPE